MSTVQMGIEDVLRLIIANIEKGKYGNAKEVAKSTLNQLERAKQDTGVKEMKTGKLE